MPSSDAEIIKDYLNGKQAAFDLISEWIRIVVHHRLREERESADDIVADTNEQLFINLRNNSFRLESSLKTYVQRVTLYTIVNAIRRKHRLRRLHHEYAASAPTMENPHESQENEEQTALYLRVHSLIDQGCKDLWRMIFYDTTPYKEVARILDVNEGTLRARITRCKQKAIEIRKRITGSK